VHITFGQRSEIYEMVLPVQIPLRRGFPSMPLIDREPFFHEFDIDFRMGYTETKGKFVIRKVKRRRPTGRYV